MWMDESGSEETMHSTEESNNIRVHHLFIFDRRMDVSPGFKKKKDAFLAVCHEGELSSAEPIHWVQTGGGARACQRGAA